jgi:GNAT superfamily N-acetyltransferase
MTLDQIEAYYDTVPRIATTTEEVGPFTLFLSVPGTHRVLAADDEDLGLAIGAIAASFDGTDEYVARDAGKRPELIRSGHLIMVGSYDESGRLVGGGSTSPRVEVTELMGIGVLPSARKQGRGGITRALVRAARSCGVTTAFLSAASDDAASVYRAVGFERVATACILEAASPEVNSG